MRRYASGFARYELLERVMLQLPVLGFMQPTEVQGRVIPLFSQGKNLIVEAPTGTGKTAAYGLPLISKLELEKRSTQALVLAPSRELAMQIEGALRSFFQGDQLRVGAVYGGVTMQESFEAIRAGYHILVAVPGRLRDVMAHYKYDYLWRDIKYLIIDEGDKLLESGFQKDFDEILKHVRTRAQVAFFSATISKDAESLIRDRIEDVFTLRLNPRNVLRNISFFHVRVSEGKRENFLDALIQQQYIFKALIFCGRREEIFTVCGYLRNAGYKAEAYYGSQEQEERENILNRFKEGHIDYLVASDLAARGLDIEQLPAVINISLPKEYDFYLHRIGRTGRAGNPGFVYNLITGEAERILMNTHHKELGIPARELKLENLTVKRNTDKLNRWMKVHISRGKKDKIRKGDVVGFLTQTGEMEADQIGTITIFDTYTLVDLSSLALDKMIGLDIPLVMKGLTVKIRVYRLEEQERRARAVKNLKKDRR